MPKKGFHRSLQTYFSKLKKVPPVHLPNQHHHHNSTASRLLSACKYPKTPSFAADRDDTPDDSPAAATLSDVDRFLQDNFHSLYARQAARDDDSRDPSTSSPRYDDDDDDLPTDDLRSSDRFFVSPGTSNSLAEPEPSADDSSSASSGPSDSGPVVPGAGVAVTTFSKDPYDDFRHSMQEMVEARHVDRRRPLDWDFMEELLFCYLELNDRSVHKYILRAFTDLTASFRRRAPSEGRSKGRRRRRGRGGREDE